MLNRSLVALSAATRSKGRSFASKAPHEHSAQCVHPPPTDRSEDVPDLKTVPRPKFMPSYIDHCMQMVKKVDYPAYYCTLFLPGPSRFATFGLRAFNIETAAVKNKVTSSQAAALKLAWWRQVVDACYEKQPPNHPVALALGDAIHNFKLTRSWFIKIIDSREKDLRTTQPRTLNDIELYAENTASSLLYLTLESLTIRDMNADHAASHLGKAMGLATLIRALPFHAKAKQIYIPIDLCVKHKLTSEDIFAGKVTQGVQDAVYEIANQAKNHLDLSRELLPTVKYPANLALLQAEWTDNFLATLQKKDFNPFDPTLLRNNFAPQVWTLKNYYLNKY